MRVLIDTNCFLAIIPRISPYRPIFDAFRSKLFDLVVSTEILDEYSEIFTREMSPQISDNLLELILRQTNTIKTEIYFKWGLITQDYDDNKFVDAAISSNANFLISNDKHYNILKKNRFPNVTVINLEEFLRILKEL